MCLSFESEFAPLCHVLVIVIGAMWVSPSATLQLVPCFQDWVSEGMMGCFVHSVCWFGSVTYLLCQSSYQAPCDDHCLMIH